MIIVDRRSSSATWKSRVLIGPEGEMRENIEKVKLNRKHIIKYEITHHNVTTWSAGTMSTLRSTLWCQHLSPSQKKTLHIYARRHVGGALISFQLLKPPFYLQVQNTVITLLL